MEDKIKELISMYLKDDAYKKEDMDEILGQTWQWLVNEYDRNNRSHVALITVIYNFLRMTVSCSKIVLDFL